MVFKQNKFSNKFSKIEIAIISLFLLLAIAAAMQAWFSPPKFFTPNGKKYTEYNNYIIFKQSSVHLLHNVDLYKLYPNEQWDYYKYSPTFAMLFIPLSFMPDWLGLSLWDMLNVIVFLLAILLLPNLSQKQKIWILLLSIVEMTTSIQNEQSNTLMAGLLVFIFVFLENKKLFFATLVLSITVFIKLYGLVAIVLFLFYPEKLKAGFYIVFWFTIMFLLPIPVTGTDYLVKMYKSWWHLLANDISTSSGLSVMGWLYTWFGIHVNKFIVIIIGILLSTIPFFKVKLYKIYKFRLLILSMILIWVVIFNPKAESPTFIIAITGAAIWFAISPRNIINIILITLAVIFTSLSSTDLFPNAIRDSYFVPYVIKVVPCIFIWLKIVIENINIYSLNKAQYLE